MKPNQATAVTEESSTCICRPTNRFHERADPIDVSIIMPCLNEERTIGDCILAAQIGLTLLNGTSEIIVVDNGSSDRSAEIATKLGAKVVSEARKGYGSSLLKGIQVASGRLIIMGDADSSYDFSKLGPFIDKLEQDTDLVVGNRFQGGILPGAMPWHHKWIGNPVLTWILNLFFHSGIGDTHCGLRAFKKQSIEKLNLCSSGMEFASEMILKAAISGLKIAETPVTLRPDGRDRPPHLRSFRDGWRHLRLLLLYSPKRLLVIPPLLFIIIGILFYLNLLTTI